MLPDIDDPTYIDAFTYVKRSKNRQQVIKILATSKNKVPSDITEEMNVRFSLVSRILRDLKNKNIVACINEEDKTGRVYRLTDIGKKIYNDLD